MSSSKGDLLNPYIRRVVESLTEIVLVIYLPETEQTEETRERQQETQNLNS